MGNRRRKGRPPKQTNPNSLANLVPHKLKPGDILNPTGKNGAPYRPYSQAMEWLSAKPLHEHFRVAMNIRFKNQVCKVLRQHPDFYELEPDAIPDLYPEDVTWAAANAIRMHVMAILDGDVQAAVECRESVEGRSTTRLEFVSKNDKLDALLSAFRAVAAMAPRVIEVNSTVVRPEGDDGSNGNR